MSEILFCGLLKEGAIKLCSFYNEVIYFNFNIIRKIKEAQRRHRKPLFLEICAYLCIYDTQRATYIKDDIQ